MDWPAVNVVRAEAERLHGGRRINTINLASNPSPTECVYAITFATELQIAMHSEFGGFEHEGKVYTGEQHPYIDGTHEEPTYRAMATDAAGNRYLVMWAMKPKLAALPVEERPDDDSLSCDWDSPTSVELFEEADTKPTAEQLDMSVDAMELAQRKPLDGEERAELGIDGNAAFALLGENIQEGECEFVELVNGSLECKISGCHKAMRQLRTRLNRPELSYYFGISHPYGN